jgi:hypothetical protein
LIALDPFCSWDFALADDLRGQRTLRALLLSLPSILFAGSAHAGLCGAGVLDRQSIALSGTIETVDSWGGVWLVTLAQCSDLDIVLSQDPACPSDGSFSVKGTFYYCSDGGQPFDGGHCRFHAVDDVTELACQGPAVFQTIK